MPQQIKRTVIILSISSDIGKFLATHYLAKGYRVVGTYRQSKSLKDLSSLKDAVLLKCDISRKNDIHAFIKALKSKRIAWDIMISCVGEPLPVVPFFDCDFDIWQQSVEVNSLAQLRVLHALNPMRNKNANVIFFAGGGMNNAVINFSAYTIGKIILAKMCEFIDVEDRDLKISIIGPGWVKTKIHNTIMNDATSCQVKVKATKAFFEKNEGTALVDIAACIDWVIGLSKKVGSGRNFSVVYDQWQTSKRKKLEQALAKDVNMYKLRRSGNNWKK